MRQERSSRSVGGEWTAEVPGPARSVLNAQRKSPEGDVRQSAATVVGLVSSWLLYGAALNGDAGHSALYKESPHGQTNL